MRKIPLIITAFNLTTASLFCAPSSILFDSDKNQHIFVNNRIVANVRGKAVSIIDVMKKMDLVFYRRFPEYSSSVEARFQFYQINWRHILKEIIEKELILADAEESKIPISNGDIRQEMENLFGPNIIANLDKAGLTYDDAWELVKEEIIMRKMISFKINAKAVRSVVPNDVRTAYEEFAKKNKTPDQWSYRVITVRGKDPTECAETANSVLHFVNEGISSIDNLQEKLKDPSITRNKTTVSLSEEYKHSEKELSDSYKEIITSLAPNEFSKPIAQKSKADKSMVFRIFYLKEPIKGGVPPFAEVEPKLKNKLIDDAVDKEANLYMAKLRAHFNVKEEDQAKLIPDNFEPFSLK